MKKAMHFLIILCVCIIAIVSFGEAKAESVVKIGLILPLTGPRASIGQDAQQGALLALEDIKKKDPSAGMKIKLEFEDSQGDPRVGVTAYKQLRANGVRFVLTQNSNVSLPISELVNRDKTIQLAITTTSDKYSKKDDLTFRVNGPSLLEAKYMVEHLAAKHRERPGAIALVVMEDVYPLSLMNNTLRELKQRKLPVAYQDTFLPNDFDFRALISKLKSEEIMYLVLLAYQTQAGHFVKQANELQLNPNLVITSTPVNNVEFFEAAGPAASGVLVTYIKHNANHPAAREFESLYQKPVNFFSSNGYDGVTLAYRAIKSCEFQTEPSCLKKALFSTKNFEGLSGVKSFDDIFGDMEDQYSVLVAREGQFVPMDPDAKSSLGHE